MSYTLHWILSLFSHIIEFQDEASPEVCSLYYLNLASNVLIVSAASDLDVAMRQINNQYHKTIHIVLFYSSVLYILNSTGSVLYFNVCFTLTLTAIRDLVVGLPRVYAPLIANRKNNTRGLIIQVFKKWCVLQYSPHDTIQDMIPMH